MSRLVRGGAVALLLVSAGTIAQDRKPEPTSQGGEAVASLQDNPGGGGTSVPVAVTGEQVYRQVCQACHMADAKGGAGGRVVPGLAANPRMAAAAYPITLVVRGRGAMPAFAGTLKPAQVAAAVTYVRTHFGNNYPAPVTEEDVKKLWSVPGESDH